MGSGLGNRVLKLRERAGVTQETLAEAVGVTRQTIIAIERGNYIPSTLLAFKIAKYFQRRVDDVFFLT